MSLPQFSAPQFSAPQFSAPNFVDLSQLLGISKSLSQTLDHEAILARVRTNWRARLPPSADSGLLSGSSGWEDVRSFVGRDDDPSEIEDSYEKVLQTRSLSARPDVFVQETQESMQGAAFDLVQGTCVDSSQAYELAKSLTLPITDFEPIRENLEETDDIPDPPSEAELPASEEEVEEPAEGEGAVPLEDTLIEPLMHEPVIEDTLIEPIVDPFPAPLAPPQQLPPQSDDYVASPASPVAGSLGRTISSPMSRRSEHSLTSIPSPSPSDYHSKWSDLVAERERRQKLKKQPESPPKLKSARARSSVLAGKHVTTPHQEGRQKTKHILDDVASILCNTDGPERRRRTRKRSMGMPRTEYSKTLSFPDPVEEEELLYPEGALNFSDRNEASQEPVPTPAPELDPSSQRDAEPPPSIPPPPLEPLSPLLPNGRGEMQSPSYTLTQPHSKLKASPPFEPPALLRHDFLDDPDDVPSPPRSEFLSRPPDARLEPIAEAEEANEPPHSARSRFKSSPPFARYAPLVRDTPSPAVRETISLISPPPARIPLVSPEVPPSPNVFESPPPVRSTARQENSNSSIGTTFSAKPSAPSSSSHLMSPETPSRTTLLPWGNPNSPHISQLSPQCQVTPPPPTAISPAITPLPITPLHPIHTNKKNNESLPLTQPYPSHTPPTSSEGVAPVESVPRQLEWEPEDDDEAELWNDFGCESQILDFPLMLPPKKVTPKTPKPHLPKPVLAVSSTRSRDEMSQVLDFAPVTLPSSKKKKLAGLNSEFKFANDR